MKLIITVITIAIAGTLYLRPKKVTFQKYVDISDSGEILVCIEGPLCTPVGHVSFLPDEDVAEFYALNQGE